MKIKKDNILICIQERTPLSYETVKEVYSITKSYDVILELNHIAMRFNKDIVELAVFLTGGKE